MSAPAPLLKADDLAEWWQCPRMSVYTAVREKGLPAIRIGRSLRFDRRAVEAWMERNSSVAAADGE